MQAAIYAHVDLPGLDNASLVFSGGFERLLRSVTPIDIANGLDQTAGTKASILPCHFFAEAGVDPILSRYRLRTHVLHRKPFIRLLVKAVFALRPSACRKFMVGSASGAVSTVDICGFRMTLDHLATSRLQDGLRTLVQCHGESLAVSLVD